MSYYTYISERKKEYNKRYKDKQKQKGIDYVKRWKQKHRKEVLEYHKKYNKLYPMFKKSTPQKLKIIECQNCGYKKHPEILVVHHIKHRASGGTSESSNLKILCPNCHSLFHHNIF